MCGIVGWIGNSAPLNNEVLASALQLLQHRGPDHGNHIRLNNNDFFGSQAAGNY